MQARASVHTGEVSARLHIWVCICAVRRVCGATLMCHVVLSAPLRVPTCACSCVQSRLRSIQMQEWAACVHTSRVPGPSHSWGVGTLPLSLVAEGPPVRG